MKRIKPHNVQSALQQYRLVAVYFGNGLMRADIGHIWLLYGTAVLERRKSMRLIDADKLSARLSRNATPYFTVSDIENAPTIDAVPVVRCWECKHHRDKNEHERQYLAEGVLICTSSEATDDCWNAVWPDHFCSYGERKEGADNGC